MPMVELIGLLWHKLLQFHTAKVKIEIVYLIRIRSGIIVGKVK